MRKIQIFFLFVIFFGNLNSEEPSKICLTMIVKNESRIIERCLNSVKEIADYISICDTGSTDNTVAIIESFMEKNKIPGKVHHQEWKNFGYNRTLAVSAAREMLAEHGENLNNVYLLLLDADMILEVSPNFSKFLKDDNYLIQQQSGSISYYNTRLIKASMPWYSKGVTHEYWACIIPHKTSQLQTLTIDDHEDGGSKSDKFERDYRLLTQGLKDEPDNERYMFYCGMTCKALKKYDEAVHWYKERIAKGGWKEEVWHSKYMIGEIYEELGFWDQALHWYLDAYQYNPERSETLKKISGYYRNNGNNELAYLFASHGTKIPYPTQQMLFVEHPVYQYRFDEDLSIASYYTHFKEDGFDALNRVMLNKEAPDYTKELAYKNMLYYVDNFKNAKFIPIAIELPLIRNDLKERYSVMNPSIQKTEDGYLLICRTVNFTQRGGKEYRSKDPDDSTIRTRNFLVRMDKNFNLLSQQEIIDDLPRQRIDSQVKGLEDCRLIVHQGAPCFLATVFDHPPGGVIQAFCRLQKNSEPNKSVPLQSLVPLKGPSPGRCEKNWLPFAKDNKLHAIYSYDPLILLQIDEKTGECKEVLRRNPAQDFSRFRGSAGPIPFDDGYLAVIHEVVFTDQRTYTHRFVYLDKEFNIAKISKPFTFLHKGIEYCCGITTDHSGNNCLLTISNEDREAFICVIRCDEIRASL